MCELIAFRVGIPEKPEWDIWLDRLIELTDQRHIVHSQHDDALVFGAVFAPASDVRFDDVSAVLVVFGGS